MKLSTLKSLSLALVAGTALTAITPAQAQNSNFALGDIVMGFRATGGTGSDTLVYVALGGATTFRDTTGNFLNIRNVGSTLTATYGASWFDRTDLFFGAVGVRSNASVGAAVAGDPTRTIYATRERSAVGNIGSSASTPWFISSSGGMSFGSSDVLALSQRFNQDFTTSVATVLTSSTNNWSTFTVGTTDFRAFNGGVESAFDANAFGSFGAAGTVEGAVDLYRILATTTGANPTGTLRTGSYEGTFTINSGGDISFVAVPEPASIAFLTLAAIAVIAIRRRIQKNTAQI
jgi:hypothetical protein